MPIQQRDAIVILDRMIERSRDCLNTPEVRQYGQAKLVVTAKGDGETVYEWGVNIVPRHVAVNVVASFTDSVR